MPQERLPPGDIPRVDRRRWLRWFLPVGLLLPILVLAVVSYERTDRDLTGITLARRQSVAQLAAALLKDKLDRVVDLGVSLSTRILLPKLVGEGKWEEAIEVLKAIPIDFPYVDRILLTDPSGTLRTDIPARPEARGTSFAFRDWYLGVSRAGKPYVSEVYRRTAEPRINVIAAAVPIRVVSGETAGILVLQLRTDTLLEWGRAIDVGASGFIYFVDQRGHVAGHPNLPPQGEIPDYSEVPVVRKLLRGESGIEVLFNPVENEERLSAYQPVPGYGWGVVVQQPARAAFAQRDASLRDIVIVFGLAGLVNAVLGGFLLRTWAERDRSAEALRRQTEILESVLNGVGDGVVVADAAGKFLVFNPTAERILGVGRIDEPPARWSERYGVYRPDAVTPFPAEDLPLTRALRGEPTDDIELYIRNEKLPQGAYVSVSGRSLNDPRGAPAGGVVVVRDITRRREDERSLRERTEQLAAVNRELEAFSYSVSHDLRAPLRHITGFAEMLVAHAGPALDEKGLRHLETIRAAAGKMGRLIDDLLAFSRTGRAELRKTAVNLDALARDAAREAGAEASGRSIEWKIDALPEVEADSSLMRQVFVNLLENAVKYTGGRERAVIEVGSSAGGPGEAAVVVRDNGAGFDMRYADKLFGVFQRLHGEREFPGTGIGLANVKRIIQRHGGRVWAEGKVGEGAAFYFALPAGLDSPRRHEDTK